MRFNKLSMLGLLVFASATVQATRDDEPRPLWKEAVEFIVPCFLAQQLTTRFALPWLADQDPRLLMLGAAACGLAASKSKDSLFDLRSANRTKWCGALGTVSLRAFSYALNPFAKLASGFGPALSGFGGMAKDALLGGVFAHSTNWATLGALGSGLSLVGESLSIKVTRW